MLDPEAVLVQPDSASLAEVEDQVEDESGAGSFIIVFAGPLVAEPLVVPSSSKAVVEELGALGLSGGTFLLLRDVLFHLVVNGLVWEYCPEWRLLGEPFASLVAVLGACTWVLATCLPQQGVIILPPGLSGTCATFRLTCGTVASSLNWLLSAVAGWRRHWITTLGRRTRRPCSCLNVSRVVGAARVDLHGLAWIAEVCLWTLVHGLCFRFRSRVFFTLW